ncbi:hypothetical protein Moror_15620 [Moniliophthora roreri MCA 2997]|uniref:Uncharacterized protein n=2 Tax=Moniliophthora roreri TaxID=221103 RepID=V2WP90_MONRO|nr:hypothetical protein Moror_15620 [Moniliophthora roreri MCA 2997]
MYDFKKQTNLKNQAEVTLTPGRPKISTPSQLSKKPVIMQQQEPAASDSEEEREEVLRLIIPSAFFLLNQSRNQLIHSEKDIPEYYYESVPDESMGFRDATGFPGTGSCSGTEADRDDSISGSCSPMDTDTEMNGDTTNAESDIESDASDASSFCLDIKEQDPVKAMTKILIIAVDYRLFLPMLSPTYRELREHGPTKFDTKPANMSDEEWKLKLRETFNRWWAAYYQAHKATWANNRKSPLGDQEDDSEHSREFWSNVDI